MLFYLLLLGFPDGSVVKNTPAVQETYRRSRFNPWVGNSPGEGNGNPSSILAWRVPWIEEPGGL